MSKHLQLVGVLQGCDSGLPGQSVGSGIIRVSPGLKKIRALTLYDFIGCGGYQCSPLRERGGFISQGSTHEGLNLSAPFVGVSGIWRAQMGFWRLGGFR